MTPVNRNRTIQNSLSVCLISLLGFAFSVEAVDTLKVTSPDPVLEKWRWTAFDRRSGLAGAVYEIFEDRDGNIWFGTENGVQKYDGLTWTTYTTDERPQVEGLIWAP